ncbi:hypothetical protein [Methanobrevibacter arboriphilus]|uniref:hypothetical protein n=1 Tax=Methanobrevibacter arboriphilus TaxID=39441 RepID=UPI0021E6333F|nr:hypothetical protein [Methanobrevibacter arboriphilus]
MSSCVVSEYAVYECCVFTISIKDSTTTMCRVISEITIYYCEVMTLIVDSTTRMTKITTYIVCESTICYC